MANDLFRVPVQPDDDRHPAEGLDHDLGHVNAPPLGWGYRPGFAACRRPRGLQSGMGLHQQDVLPHQPQHAFLVDQQPVHAPQVAQMRR